MAVQKNRNKMPAHSQQETKRMSMIEQRETPQSRMHENPTPKMPTLAWLLAVCALCAATACSDGKIKRYPVTGTITVDGKPAEGVRVMFHPVGGDEDFQKIRALAFTDENGKYELNTFGKSDGCPVGEFAVTASWPNGGPATNTSDGERVERRSGPDHLNGRYRKKATSGLTAEVTSTGGTFDFELSTK